MCDYLKPELPSLAAGNRNRNRVGKEERLLEARPDEVPPSTCSLSHDYQHLEIIDFSCVGGHRWFINGWFCPWRHVLLDMWVRIMSLYSRGLLNEGFPPLHTIALIWISIAPCWSPWRTQVEGRPRPPSGAEMNSWQRERDWRATCWLLKFCLDVAHLFYSHPFARERHVSVSALNSVCLASVSTVSSVCFLPSWKVPVWVENEAVNQIASPGCYTLHTASPFASWALAHNPLLNPLSGMHFRILKFMTTY